MPADPILFARLAPVACALAALALGPAARAQTVATGDGLSVSLTSNARVSALSVGGDNLTPAPSAAVRVRDLSTAGSAFSPNLLLNPGLETDADGDGVPDNWSIMLLQSASVALTTGDRAEGFRSVLVDLTPGANGGAALASDPVPVVPGARYRVSAQMKARDGYLTWHGTSLVWQKEIYEEPTEVSGIHIQWLDGAGQPLGDPSVVAPLHTNASHWKRITGEVVAPLGAASAQVILGAKLNDTRQEGEGLWIDDASMILAPELDADVAGTVTVAGSDLILSGSVPGAGLEVEVTYSPSADHLEISGQVTDTTGVDRAIDLSLRLPADLGGYTWWDDMRTPRTVSGSNEYANTISGEVGGWLPISLYPLAALDDQTHGLSLALPLDSPQVALLRYAGGALEAVFRLGISPQATKLGGSATFKAYVATFDPQWGFRAALAKLASIAPQWFQSNRDVYSFKGFEQGNYTNPTQALLALEHDASGTASAQYTAPEGPLQVADFTDPPPSYDAITQYILTNQSDPGVMALANSLATDGNGDFFLKLLTIPNWDPTHWVSIWVLDMDPELPGGYAEWIRDYKVDPAFAMTSQYGAQLDAIEFDNFLSAPAIDLDPSHLALADSPLSYDPNTYRPGLHTAAATHEFLSWLADHILTNYGAYPGFSANVWGVGTVNALAPFLDALFNEGNPGRDGNWTYDILNYRRAIAYHKPIGFANQEPDVTVSEATRFASRALFYGINGGPGAHGIGWQPGAVEVTEQASLLLERYWQLGWEPITYATTDSGAVWVERFGSNPDQGLYFAVYNSGAAASSYTVTIDTGALGVPSPPALVVKEIRSDATLAYGVSGSGIEVSGTLAAEDADVIRLMEPGCAPLSLSKASLSLREESGKDKLTLQGTFAAPAGPPDFPAESVALTVSDRDGSIFSATIPAGSFVANSSGTRFKFKDRTGSIAGGLTYASFKRTRDGSYKWKAKAKNVDLGSASWQYIDTRLAIGPDCMVDTTSCEIRAGGRKLSCRAGASF